MTNNPPDYKKIDTPADIRRIFTSLRKRARAAYVFRRNFFLGVTYTQPELAPAQVEVWDNRTKKLENEITGYEKAILEAPRSYMRTEAIRKIIRNVREYEADAFHRERGKKYIASLKTKAVPPTWGEKTRIALRELKSRFPYVSSKNSHRLAKLLAPFVVGKSEFSGALYAADLVTAGIPAAEVSGPWFKLAKSIHSPMDFIRQQGTKYPSLSPAQVWQKSPDAGVWLSIHDLDGDDRELRERVEKYYKDHGCIPSVEWARQQNNLLEAERMQAEIEESVGPITDWLQASHNWRLRDDVVVPILPPGFKIIEPSMAVDLCQRAKRDGLCVVDVLKDMVEDVYHKGLTEEDEDRFDNALFRKAKAENIITLLVCTDNKRRTIVGLNEDGKCTSEHHCTGRDNKVDKEAWEYFR